jgi:hypothetical protein
MFLEVLQGAMSCLRDGVRWFVVVQIACIILKHKRRHAFLQSRFD